MTAELPASPDSAAAAPRRRDRAADRPPPRQERRSRCSAAARSAGSFLVAVKALPRAAPRAAAVGGAGRPLLRGAVDQGRRSRHIAAGLHARPPVRGDVPRRHRRSASSSTSTRRRTWSTTRATRASSAYLNLFTGSMLILVLGDSLPVTFVGWEGVGLCSYLLIGFWFDKEANALAGRKAFVVNRIGDFGFLLGMFLIYSHDRHAEVLASCRKHVDALHAAMWFGLPVAYFVGPARCSSAPPASRRRSRSTSGCPTPWPARRRSRRSSTPPPWSPPASTWSRACTSCSRSRRSRCAVVAVVGAATALFAATIGIAQRDIKKVLAYSTISQLGFMFVGVGSYLGGMPSSNYQAGIFHLVTHAFFKAGLFLGAGSVMHAPGRRRRHHAAWAASRSRCRTRAGPSSSTASPSPASSRSPASGRRTRSSAAHRRRVADDGAPTNGFEAFFVPGTGPVHTSATALLRSCCSPPAAPRSTCSASTSWCSRASTAAAQRR